MNAMNYRVNWPRKLFSLIPKDMSSYCEFYEDDGCNLEQCQKVTLSQKIVQHPRLQGGSSTHCIRKMNLNMADKLAWRAMQALEKIQTKCLSNKYSRGSDL